MSLHPAPGIRHQWQERRKQGAGVRTSCLRAALQALSSGGGARLLKAALIPHLGVPPPLRPPPAPVTQEVAGAGRSGAGGSGHCIGPFSDFLTPSPHARGSKLTETSQTEDCPQSQFLCKPYAFLALGFLNRSRRQICTALPKRSRNLGLGLGPWPSTFEDSQTPKSLNHLGLREES